MHKNKHSHCPVCGQPGFSYKEVNGKPIVYCHYSNCSWQEILYYLRSGESIQSISDPIKEELNPINYAWQLWEEDSFPPEETPVMHYLRYRGYNGAIPPVIRYLPSHKHTSNGLYYPVMLTKITDKTGRFQAIHRTYLQSDGQGKASVTPPKMTFGTIKGGAIRLADAPTDQLILCEGIETGLALLQEWGKPVWSCISAGGLRSIQLPDSVVDVIIAADNDLNEVGLKAAQYAAERFDDEGRKVRFILPSKPGTDFADEIFRMENAR